jgi:hypothetical protein
LTLLAGDAASHGRKTLFGDLDYEEITRDFHKDRKVAGVPHRTPEGSASLTSLRKLRATALQQGGVGLVEAQRLMRHSSPDITANHYTTVTSAAMRQSVEALAATLGPKKLVPAAGVEPTLSQNATSFTVQANLGDGVTINSCKIEQLARLTAVWFSLPADTRERVMLLAGYAGPQIVETRG